jgi:hypothetical protein
MSGCISWICLCHASMKWKNCWFQSSIHSNISFIFDQWLHILKYFPVTGNISGLPWNSLFKKTSVILMHRRHTILHSRIHLIQLKAKYFLSGCILDCTFYLVRIPLAIFLKIKFNVPGKSIVSSRQTAGAVEVTDVLLLYCSHACLNTLWYSIELFYRQACVS